MTHRSGFISGSRNHGWMSSTLLIVSLAMTSRAALGTEELPGDPPGGGGPEAWHQTQFMIGTDDGPCLTNHNGQTSGSEFTADVARIQFAKDFGLTMTWVAPEFTVPFSHLFDQNYMLTSMSQGGLQTWLPCDDGGPLTIEHPNPAPGWWTRPWNVDTANAITTRALSQSPSLRAAQLGYFITSEPGQTHMDYVKNWVAHVHAADPSKLGYVTVREMGPAEGAPGYSSYLESWFNDPDPTRRPDVLSFDHYPFTHEDDICAQAIEGEGLGIVQNYFENLAIARDRALGRPIWLYVSTQQYWYMAIVEPNPCSDASEKVLRLRPDPTPEMLRFQIYCPLAYGVKGILYWNYLQPPTEAGPVLEGQGIMANCETKNPKYDDLKSNNLYIRDIVGPAVMNSAWIGAFHRTSQPTGETIATPYLITGSSPVVAGTDRGEMLFGVFAKPQNVQHLLVVNKQFLPGSGTPVSVKLRGDYTDKVEISPSPVGYTGTVTWTPIATTYTSSNNLTTFSIPAVAGGEGRLVRLNKDGIAPASSVLAHCIHPTSLTFSWVVPGDDVMSNGPATSYEIRSSTSPLTTGNFASGSLVVSGPLVSGGSTVSEVTVEVGGGFGSRYYAIRFIDDVGNLSAVGANTPLIGTPFAPTIADLAACHASKNCVLVGWTAPGTGVQYDVRCATYPLTECNLSDAPQVIGPTVPVPAGHAEYTVTGLNQGTTYYLAMRTAVVYGKYGPWSNVVQLQTPTSGLSCANVMCGDRASRPATEVDSQVELALLPPVPNPARTTSALRFTVPSGLAGADLRLDVFDLSGRRIANVRSGPAVAGESVTTWDLRDRQGNRVRPGFYVVRLRIADRQLQRSFMIQ